MNHVLITGDVRVAPVVREIDGEATVSFDLMTVSEGGRRMAVPVLWPVASIPKWLEADTAVVVRGEVFRRFFFAGGARQSLVDVTAAEVAKATPAKLQRAIEQHVAALVA